MGVKLTTQPLCSTPVLCHTKEKSTHEGCFSLWWRRPITVHYHVKEYMDYLDVTNFKPVMARIGIKALIIKSKHIMALIIIYNLFYYKRRCIKFSIYIIMFYFACIIQQING